MVTLFWGFLFCFYGVLCEGIPLDKELGNRAFKGFQDDNSTITDETLKELFGKLKEYIGHDQGFKKQGIFMNTTEIFLNGTLSDVHITDLSAYTIPVAHVNMTILSFEVDMTYSELNVKGNYEIDAENDAFHLVGNGPFSGNVQGLTIAIAWKFNLTNEGTLQMESFDLNYIVPNITVHFDNLGGDEVVSQTLNDLINIGLPSMINVTKGDVEKFVNKIIQHYSAFLFTGMTVDQFVAYVHDIIDM